MIETLRLESVSSNLVKIFVLHFLVRHSTDSNSAHREQQFKPI
jgi:hypothetical protein